MLRSDVHKDDRIVENQEVRQSGAEEDVEKKFSPISRAMRTSLQRSLNSSINNAASNDVGANESMDLHDVNTDGQRTSEEDDTERNKSSEAQEILRDMDSFCGGSAEEEDARKGSELSVRDVEVKRVVADCDLDRSGLLLCDVDKDEKENSFDRSGLSVADGDASVNESTDSGRSRASRRAKAVVNYKEKSLNVRRMCTC